MQIYPFTLEALPYDYKALEPYIDEQTMMIHHDKHHQTYVNNLNQALSDAPQYQTMTLEQLLLALPQMPTNLQSKVRNNGGGVYNHNLFWDSMTPTPKKEPVGPLLTAIKEAFGSVDAWKQEFKKAALGQFGSGWAWLVKNKEGNVQIVATPNQDTPLAAGLIPILLLDVWEHAYYLKYQNRRADYIDQWFQVINWDIAEKRFQL